MKEYKSQDYNYIFDTKSGFFARWGKTLNDDPDYSPVGPEILDIEVSEICHQGCPMCYKSNVASKGNNMTLDTFKSIIDKMPTVLQVAIGIGDVDGNPDLFDMMRYCRSKNIVPNITINGYRLTDDIVSNLVSLCGAISVSNYDKDVCYDAVKRLTDAGMKQVNIHQLLSMETYLKTFEVVEDFKNDDRLKNLNAIVFLSLKQKGRGQGYHKFPNQSFQRLVIKCLDEDVRFGFDSCTACKFTNAIKNDPRLNKILPMIEPCESTLFSSYVNVEGKFYPCSFAETGDGIDVANCNNFLNDVWMNDRTNSWRENLLARNRNCPIYDV
jgi:MoaA/NifB/PqqE/SkfB family radical SAM enzyme